MLGIIEGTKYEDGGSGSASAIHYLAEAMRLAYADRNEYVGDPAFVKVPIAGLLDPAYHARLRATIDPQKATPSSMVKPGKPAGSESIGTFQPKQVYNACLRLLLGQAGDRGHIQVGHEAP